MKDEFVEESRYESWLEMYEESKDEERRAVEERHSRPFICGRDDPSALETSPGYKEECVYRYRTRGEHP